MNDKGIVQSCQDSFDVLVVQANLAVSTHRGLSSWQDLQKPFWIDPIAYAFVSPPAFLMSHQKVRGTDQTQFDFKSTFRALAQEYGAPFTPLRRDRLPLTPGDFVPDQDENVVKRIIDWQRNVLSPPEEDAKYVEGTGRLEPVLLTVPYFPLTRPGSRDSDPDWLDVNVRLIKAAIRSYPGEVERLAAGVLIDDNLFDSDILERVFDRYLETDIGHLWLWVSEIDEVALTTPRAERLRELVRLASERDKRIHQAFGGGFSPLLFKDGLTSVGHGVAYWEHKNWQPLAGGGLPTLRYYFPPLRARLRFLDVDVVISELISDSAQFHDRICRCATCSTTLAGNLANFAHFGEVRVRTRIDTHGRRRDYDVPVPTALALTKSHYLRARGGEVRDASQRNFDAIQSVQDALDFFGDSAAADVRHLRNWIGALS